MRELESAGASLVQVSSSLAMSDGSFIDCSPAEGGDAAKIVCCAAARTNEVTNFGAHVVPPAWARPPSQRLKRTRQERARKAAPALASENVDKVANVLERFAGLSVTGLRVGEGHILLVTAGTPAEGRLICLAPRRPDSPKLTCTVTALEKVAGVMRAGPTTLVVAESGFGNPRDNFRFLVSIQPDIRPETKPLHFIQL